MLDRIPGAARGVLHPVPSAARGILGAVAGLPSGVLGPVPGATSGIFDPAKRALARVLQPVPRPAGRVLDSIERFPAGIFHPVQRAAAGLFYAIPSLARGSLQPVPGFHRIQRVGILFPRLDEVATSGPRVYERPLDRRPRSIERIRPHFLYQVRIGQIRAFLFNFLLELLIELGNRLVRRQIGTTEVLDLVRRELPIQRGVQLGVGSVDRFGGLKPVLLVAFVGPVRVAQSVPALALLVTNLDALLVILIVLDPRDTLRQ